MRCCVWVLNLMSHPKGSNRVGCMRTNSRGEWMRKRQEKETELNHMMRRIIICIL